MKTILCFGDSNTYGYQPETKKRYDETTRWTCLLQQAIQPYGWRVVEEGLCGRTTNLNGIRRENRNGAAVLPMLLESHATPESIGAGIEALIAQVRAFDEQLPILLVSPIHLAADIAEKDSAFSADSVSISYALKSVYAAIAEREHCMFFAASDYAEPSDADGEHLDAEGHQKLTKQMLNALQPLLCGKEQEK